MKTRKELEGMNLIALGKLARELNIQNCGKCDKVTLVNQIVEKLESKDVVVFSDRNDKPIVVTQHVQCRVGGTWYHGTIEKLKMIDEDQYATVLLDGQEKTKMFHVIDIDANVTLPTTSKKDLLNGLLKKESLPEVSIEEVLEGESEIDTIFPKEEETNPKEQIEKPVQKAKTTTPRSIKEILPVVKEKPEFSIKEKAVLNEKMPEKVSKKLLTAPHPGSKSEKIVELLNAGKTRSEVSKELNAVYSFVVTIDKRYRG